MANTYSQKLKKPKWQKKRLRIFERDNWTCQSCFRDDLPLHVHHLRYIPEYEPWDYDDHLLITYCEICHETHHLIGGQINESLLEIIKDKPLLIKQTANLCILFEKVPGFNKSLGYFLNNAMVDYLQTQKTICDAKTMV